MPSFTFTPDWGLKKSNNPAISTEQYGDGYEYRQTKGLNNNKRVWTLTFSKRTNEEADSIEEFFSSKLSEFGDFQSFSFLPPDSEDDVFVVCKKWDRTHIRFNINDITATFEEDFN